MKKLFIGIIIGSISTILFTKYFNKDKIIYKPDIKPPITAIEHQPQTNQDYIDAFNSPLWHKGNYNKSTGLYTGFVSDNWKNITFYDQIIPSYNKHTYFAGIGIDDNFNRLYTIGYIHNLYSMIGVGGFINISDSRIKDISAIISFSH
jgi:hypothetical protein